MKLALQEAKIYPIFFCTQTHLSKWTALKDKWGFGIAVEIKGDSSDLVEAVSQAMKELTGTVTLTKQVCLNYLIKYVSVYISVYIQSYVQCEGFAKLTR